MPRVLDPFRFVLIAVAGMDESRIQGALSNLGHELARSTVGDILERHRIEPAPERNRKTTWKEFLTRHWELIVAADFFHRGSLDPTRVATLPRAVPHRPVTRKAEIAGIASMANGLWMSQIGRNLTDGVDGILKGKRYLIHDRDPLFTNAFLSMLVDSGVKSVKLPPRSPNLNAYAKRFVWTIKESCLERMILFGEQSLRVVLHSFSPTITPSATTKACPAGSSARTHRSGNRRRSPAARATGRRAQLLLSGRLTAASTVPRG